KRVTVPAGDALDVPFDAGADVQRAALALAGDDADGYAADNERFAVREARSVPRVLVVTGASGSTSGFYLTRALLAERDEGRGFEEGAVAGQALRVRPPAQLPEEGVVAILSTQGLAGRAGEGLRGYLEAGGGLFVGAAADVDPAVLSTLLAWT